MNYHHNTNADENTESNLDAWSHPWIDTEYPLKHAKDIKIHARIWCESTNIAKIQLAQLRHSNYKRI